MNTSISGVMSAIFHNDLVLISLNDKVINTFLKLNNKSNITEQSNQSSNA